MPGRLIRLGAMATALFMAQAAFAVGTDPGVTVTNQAVVSYDVGGNAQPPVNSTLATFVVDRRVDFTVTRVGTALTPATLGTDQVFVEFLVLNLSNGTMDFDLDFTQLIPTDGDIYPGFPDSGIDMEAVSISVAASSNADPSLAPSPGFGGPTFIDNLPEDEYIRVRLYANAPDTGADGSVAGLSLDATAADPAGGGPLVESGSWNAATVDNVFANASGGTDVGSGVFNAIESDNDGFLLQSAALTINKTQAVISDPFSSGRAVPGARIEYTIEINNTGTAGATSISISDLVDADVTFVPDAYNGSSSNIEFDRGTPANSFCLADAGDGNSDGCTFDGSTLTIEGRDDSNPPADPDVPINVDAGETVTVNFVVEVPET
jgi:uncharacterized repeat protein (TIGR01451 family)